MSTTLEVPSTVDLPDEEERQMTLREFDSLRPGDGVDRWLVRGGSTNVL